MSSPVVITPSMTETPPYQIIAQTAMAARNSTSGVIWLCCLMERTVALKLDSLMSLKRFSSKSPRLKLRTMRTPWIVSCSMDVTSASRSCTSRPLEWSFFPKNLIV